MAVTHPIVYRDAVTGLWQCEMRDQKTGRVWGIGRGASRQEAIYNARHEQPDKDYIRKAIGWVTDHPFIGGAAVGACMAYHHARSRQTDLRLGDVISTGLIFGTAAWVIAKLAGHFSRVAGETE